MVALFLIDLKMESPKKGLARIRPSLLDTRSMAAQKKEKNSIDVRLKASGEFRSKNMELNYLQSSWKDIKQVPRYTLWAISFIGIAFFASDVLNIPNGPKLYLLLAIRILTGSILFASAEYMYRFESYCQKYQILLFFNQILIVAAIAAVAVLRKVPPAYLGVNAIFCTLLFYQMTNNRFTYTVTSCILLGIGSLCVTLTALDYIPSEVIAAVLFLGPLNFLGMTILRRMNRSRRGEYVALEDAKRLNKDNEALIIELQNALAEVKTLQGFLPICSKCHKIRDDDGYWEKIEKYIQDRTNAQFSHSICPECTKQIFSNFVKGQVS